MANDTLFPKILFESGKDLTKNEFCISSCDFLELLARKVCLLQSTTTMDSKGLNVNGAQLQSLNSLLNLLNKVPQKVKY